MKNIYAHVKEINKCRPSATALLIRMDDKTTRSFTYEEMFIKVAEIASSLQMAGAQQGNRVAIIAASSPEWIIAFLAIAKIEATSVLIDSSLDANEIERLVNKSNLSAIITNPVTEPKVPKSHNVPVFDMTNGGNLFASSVCRKCSRRFNDGDKKIASIIFSSGTTRTAAGIMHTHDSLIDSAVMTINATYLDENDHYLAMLPNSHIYGVICQMMGPLLTGADVCFLEVISGANLVSAFTQYRPTIFPSVPKVFEMLKTQILKKIDSKATTKKMFNFFFPICLNLRKKYNINLGKKIFKSVQQGFGGRVKILCSAGAPISMETADFFYGTGFDILITYGATETNIPTIGNYGKKITTNSIGKPYPDITVKTGEDGGLLIKSKYMMEGYYNDPESTKEAFTKNGWFITGDLGYIDQKGYIHLTGRSKENIILSSGKKVAPDDIEMAYANIEGAEELIVCGVPSEDGAGDEVHIFVKAQEFLREKINDQLAKKRASLAQTLAYNKIHFLESIPKTSLQKPKRYLLKKYALDIRKFGKAEINE